MPPVLIYWSRIEDDFAGLQSLGAVVIALSMRVILWLI